MHTLARTLASIALFAVVLACVPARASPFGQLLDNKAMTGCDSVTTYNTTRKWIWVTIYDLGKTQHLDFGWVAPRSSRGWRSGQYSCSEYYYVRAEVKANESAQPVDGSNIFDTTVQLSTGSDHHVVSLVPDYIWLQGWDRSGPVEHDKTFAWVSGPGDKVDISQQYRSMPRFDAPDLTVVNGSTQAMFISPVVGMNALADVRCIPPGGKTTFEMNDNGPQPFSVMGPFATCAKRTDLGRATVVPWTMDWGNHTVVLRMGLVADGVPAPGANQYSFRNTSPTAVKFVVDGVPPGQAPCVPAGAASPAYRMPPTATPGVHKVTAYTVGRCGDANDAGVKLATDSIAILPVFRNNYALGWGFFSN